MTARQFQEYLDSINACSPARRWAEGKTDKQAWEQCRRPAWLLYWLLDGRLSFSIRSEFEEYGIPAFRCYGSDVMYSCLSDVVSVKICDAIRQHFKRPTLKARKKAA